MKKILALLPATALGALLFTASSAMAKVWTVDYPASKVEFTGDVSGQSFTGHFKQFTVNVDFDPKAPEAGHISVSIPMASAESGSDERDGMMPTADWFDASKFPAATFESTSIKKGATPDNFIVSGKLTIKGVAKDVDLPFIFTEQPDGRASAKGELTLDRTAYNVGTGNWASDTYVKFPVKVNFLIAAH